MGGFGLCTSCMNDMGYMGGEATRSAGVTAALVIRQVVAAAIAADNANEMVKSYRALRDISSRSVAIAESQQAQLEKTYWPRELDHLAEFGDEDPTIESAAVLGTRYAGRLVSTVAGGFARQMRELRCNASRYCTSAFRKQFQDLMQARATALASARVLGRNIGFAEYQARTDTNFNRRMQAVGMGRGLMGEAAKLMHAAAGSLATAVRDNEKQLSSAIEAFGAARQDWRTYRQGTQGGGSYSGPTQPPVSQGPNPLSGQSSMSEFTSPESGGTLDTFNIDSGIQMNGYENNPMSTWPDMQRQEQMNTGHVGDRDLARVGAVTFPVMGVTGGTVTVDMDAFGLGFMDDRSASPAMGGAGGGMVVRPA